ncbi:hypothetical protein Q7O_003024 [Pectobacterium carotovorum subsp. carotovorum PCCS1]|nr:hypothetical protein [Pectobacterium carotovorum subsp. carotovorum PCCS1]
MFISTNWMTVYHASKINNLYYNYMKLMNIKKHRKTTEEINN